jgi:hypothetical protein
MDSRLNRIGDWEALARQAEYCATTLADLVGVTDRHLRRFFAANFELTPQEYMNGLRLWASLGDDETSLLELDFRHDESHRSIRFSENPPSEPAGTITVAE